MSYYCSFGEFFSFKFKIVVYEFIIIIEGTLIRAAAAAGCQALMTTRGSVDMWEPKVLRCAAGGHFHLPLHYGLSWEEIRETIPKNARVLLADNKTSGELGSKP